MNKKTDDFSAAFSYTVQPNAGVDRLEYLYQYNNSIKKHCINYSYLYRPQTVNNPTNNEGVVKR